MSRRSLLWFALLFACLVPTACGGGVIDLDAGTQDTDTGTSADAGMVIAREPTLPTASGACPDFFSGSTVTVSPAGIAPRPVQIWISEAARTLDGPLVFYWHGNGSRTSEAEYNLGTARIAEILATGGAVVAPTPDPTRTDFDWFLTIGTEEDDLLVADEVLACLQAQVGMDTHRIHSIGFSAGALHTSQMAFRRASYLASVVIYSGGLITRRRPRTDQDANYFSALLFHGGAEDTVILHFDETTATLQGVLASRGQLAPVCNHGLGHTLPPEEGRESAWRFLVDHPYGTYPSPYADGLPSDFYAPCELAP